MEFRILGPLEVSEGDRLLALPGPKARALLAILLIRRNQLVPTDQLIAELWGSEWPDTAGNAVHVYVSQLRRALTTAGGRSQVLQTGRKGYRLAVEPEAVDAERFEALAGLGVAALAREDFAHAERLLGDAVGLWRGPAFNDFPFERFAARERARLEERRLAALEDRFDALLALGRHADVTGELERIVDEHPLRERPHAQLMLALYRSGRQADALAAYRRIRTGLVEAAGVEPGPALRDLHHRILAQDPTLSGPNYNGRRMGRRRRGTPLPPARTTFVGRRRELLDVSALLAERRFPLLVLTGPGGVGKTRLALEAASRVADRFPDGVVLVELAVLRDSQSLLPTLAAALGFEETGSGPLPELIADRLQGSRTLLVLDSLERGAGALPELIGVLDAAGSVCAVATSRVAGDVPADWLYEVPPLGLPGDSEGASDAVSLFVERARSVRPTLTVEGDTAATIARCCEHLDGLPLAIELAAARLRVLSPESLLDRLSSSLDVLSGGGRSSPARQRTLRAAIDWSFDLLSHDEQRLFAWVSVFSGGFTVDDAEAISPGPGGSILDGITALLDTHLVYERTATGEPRFAMLETVQQYAREALERAGETELVRRRHAEHFTALVERLRPRQIPGSAIRDEGAWLSRLEADHDNLRAALEWSISHHEGDLALRLVGEVAVFWRFHGYLSEGRRWLETVLGATPRGSPLRVLPLKGLSAIARIQGDMAAAVEAAEELLELARVEGDQKGVAHALNTLGNVEADGGDPRRARRYYEESLSVTDSIGDAWNSAGTRANLAYLALSEGDLDRAGPLLEESKAVFEQVSSNYGPAVAHHNLGLLRLLLDRYDEAEALFARAAELSLEVDLPSALADSLLGLAVVASRSDDPVRAARILGSAEALWERTVGGTMRTSHVERRLYHGLVASLTESLEPEVFARERALGRSLDIEDTVRRAASAPRPEAITVANMPH